MVVKFDVKAYKKWLDETDYFFNCFNEIASKIELFLTNHYLTNEETAKNVAQYLWAAYNKCNEIDYQANDLAIAYSTVHFLDRYHRFQLSFSKLLDHKFLPISRKEIEILDVGTGPWPALYAISDVYNSLIKFGFASGDKTLQRIKFKSDYVESSNGFRHWLHLFTEIANYQNNNNQWQVPYHFGTFYDFTDIEFNIKNQFQGKTYIDRKRYNLIVFSNFLTELEQIPKWTPQIRNCFKYLRNKGKLLTVGGTGNEYKQIYAELDEILLNFNYSDEFNIGKCKKLDVRKKHLIFDLSDRYGQRLKEYYRTVYQIFERYNATSEMSEEVKKYFNNYISEKTGKPKKWDMNIYDKYARLKWYKFRGK